MNHRRVIVVVHGVGDQASGATIRAIAAQYDKRARYEERNITLGGFDYPRLVSFDPARPDLVEVNWSDLQRPRSSVAGILEHLLKLALSLLRIVPRHPQSANVSPDNPADHAGLPDLKSLTVLRFLVATCLPWTIFPVLFSAVHWCTPEARALTVLLEFTLLALAVFALRLSHAAGAIGRVTVVGWTLALIAYLTWVWFDQQSMASFAVRCYGLVQVAVIALLVVASPIVLVMSKSHGWSTERALALLALGYLPVVILSVLGSGLWAIVLISLNVLTDSLIGSLSYETWEATFRTSLGYDLALVEWSTAGATVLIAMYCLFKCIEYAWRRRGEVGPDTVAHLLYLMPILLAVPGVLALATWSFSGLRLDVPASQDVWTVYTTSALRVLPWIVVFAVRPLAIVLDVVGDVAFYVLPRQGPSFYLSTGEACRERLRSAIRYLQTEHQDQIHVVAHSQGAAIAHDVICAGSEFSRLRLTTLGCPLRTLYERFLGWRVTLPDPARVKWQNLFRVDDYVGGSIDPTIDMALERGGHTNYWSDARVLASIGT